MYNKIYIYGLPSWYLGIDKNTMRNYLSELYNKN